VLGWNGVRVDVDPPDHLRVRVRVAAAAAAAVDNAARGLSDSE
jgi:signal transduction protein with GAF and PtsI domain